MKKHTIYELLLYFTQICMPYRIRLIQLHTNNSLIPCIIKGGRLLHRLLNLWFTLFTHKPLAIIPTRLWVCYSSLITVQNNGISLLLIQRYRYILHRFQIFVLKLYSRFIFFSYSFVEIGDIALLNMALIKKQMLRFLHLNIYFTNYLLFFSVLYPFLDIGNITSAWTCC